MISRGLPLTLFLVVLAPGLLHAQQQLSVKRAMLLVDLDAQPKNDKMYEDIEILRRILDRKLHSHYVRGLSQSTSKINLNAATWYTPQGLGYIGQSPYIWAHNDASGAILWQSASEPWIYHSALAQPSNASANLFHAPATWEEVASPTLEGVYLKGQGVVFTATLSSLQPTAKTETAKPVSEWESVRRQVRNEKEEQKKADANKPQDLSDVLLKVLAENGHHFAQLAENESLTIILTVHEQNPAAKSAGPPNKTESKPPTSSSSSDSRAKIADLELLGDLHQKQGKFAEAIAAYQKAVDHKGMEPKVSASLYRKLAQCYLIVEKMEDARSALDNAARIMKNAQEAAAAKNKPASVSKPATPTLPVKVIISAPKKLLDEAKDGKLPFEEFCRRTSVETLRFENRR
jgi:tetratricopeptide (TPR) repeat protein